VGTVLFQQDLFQQDQRGAHHIIALAGMAYLAAG
jgi:hypothetical protein